MHESQLARGYRFAGVHCGIRPNPDPERYDLALIVSDAPATVAGVFTQNRVRTAPVRICQERVPSATARGVVICSGNANACTGSQGVADARHMTDVAACALGLAQEQFLVCSTGVIGRLLPMPQVESGIVRASMVLHPTVHALDCAARAILTTDTHPKINLKTISIDGVDVHLTGMAKGAAMIGPNLATMLAFVFTDASIAPADLSAATARAAGKSFNCVRVEGHTSTNDTLLVFANGQAALDMAPLEGERLARFESALAEVCGELARAIAADAEGAKHLITLRVEGLRTEEEARRVATAVADSALVKTAVFGADPNWGRIVSAAGYAGVEFEEEDLSLWVGETCLYQAGVPQPFDAAAASAYLKDHREIDIRLRFTLGQAACTFWTCDLTDEYIRLNADYTT